MRRRQLFEFTDLSGCPQWMRALVTGYLQALLNLTEPFSARLTLMLEALNHAGPDPTRIVDLCSGRGGPWAHLATQLTRLARRPLSIILTDKFPSKTARRVVSLDGIEYAPASVDANAVPASLSGLRTIFNGFHHFPPQRARAILKDAVDQRQPIVIFEMLHRSWLVVAIILTTPILVWAITPLIRPVSASRLLLTYVIPVAPLVIWWDSLVSALRCYTPAEMLAMADTADATGYTWHSGSYLHWGVPVSYLVGYPAAADAR